MSYRNDDSRRIDDLSILENIRAYPGLQSALGNEIDSAPRERLQLLNEGFELDQTDAYPVLELHHDRVIGHDGDSLGGMVASLMTFLEYGIVVAVTSNISYADTFALGMRIAEAFVGTDVSSSDVLIEENRVSVGVHGHKTGGARCLLVCLLQHLYALRLQLAL